MDNYIKYNHDILKSVLLLTLAVSGNFIGSSLSCQTQHQMKHNVYVKNFIVLFIIFFTLNFTAQDNQPPHNALKTTFVIWFTYLIFTRQNFEFTVISGLLIMITYVLDNYRSYYEIMEKETNLDQEKEKFNNLKNDMTLYRYYTFYLTIGIVIVGFLVYLKQQYEDDKESFDFVKFILGKSKCNHVN